MNTRDGASVPRSDEANVIKGDERGNAIHIMEIHRDYATNSHAQDASVLLQNENLRAACISACLRELSLVQKKSLLEVLGIQAA